LNKQALVAVGASVGCDRNDARTAGNSVEKAADKAAVAVDEALNQVGSAVVREQRSTVKTEET